MFELLKIIRRDLFLTRELCRGHYLGVTQGANPEIQKMLYFQNEYLFLGLLQPGVDKNSEDLAILILGFDDVTVNTIY